jgi:3-oxoacyl-[acyl-carrier protein] reductase
MAEREVVLVTGTSRGIGKYLAQHFACKGAVVEGCSRGAADWQSENYTHHQVDVSNESRVREMVRSIGERHGRLDIVVNNAGTASMNHVLLTPMTSVDRILDANFRGTFLVCRESAKLMVRKRYGRIINVGSVAAPMLLAGEAVYAAAKEAVLTFTKILARELGEFGITCNVVAPSPIETDLIRAVPEEKIQKLVDSLAIRRLGRYEDVANVVEFFADRKSDYITGQVIYLGGA